MGDHRPGHTHAENHDHQQQHHHFHERRTSTSEQLSSDPDAAHMYVPSEQDASTPVQHVTSPLPAHPAFLQMQTPQFKTQPWVYDLIKFLSRTTRGFVRVDLRRPTLPSPDALGSTIFTTRTHRQHKQQPRSQFQRDPAPLRPYPAPYSKFPSEVDHYYTPAPDPEPPRPLRQSGARLKITRHASLFPPADGGKPLLDVALGFNFDMDTQCLRPVARLKVKDWLAIKAVPLGVVRASKSLRIGEKLALKAAYELPLDCALRPFAPPARLMVRLDNFAGAGLHLSPTGIEFDQRVIALGDNVTVRASGSLLFPRELPIDPDRDGAFFSWKIHRLGLKTPW